MYTVRIVGQNLSIWILNGHSLKIGNQEIGKLVEIQICELFDSWLTLVGHNLK